MVSRNSSMDERLTALRGEMVREGVDGVLVPRTDRFQNEYVPAYAERLRFISGFTGSAGIAVVYADSAILFTDGRYTAQAGYECDGDLFEVLDSQAVKTEEVLAERGCVIGYDPWLLTCHQVDVLVKAGVELRALPDNLVDLIWEDQLEEPVEVVEDFPEVIAGISSADKLAALEFDAEAFVLSAPDSVAWVLNKRGNCIPHTPVVCAYGVVMDGAFVALERPYDVSFLAEKKVGLDFKRTAIWFKDALEVVGASVVDIVDPCGLPRACKTASEHAAIRLAHVRDGVAMVKFLKWVDEEAVGRSELDVMGQLEAFRAEDEAYRGASFATIAGYGANGAIIHYHSTEATNKVIEAGNFLLVDSGGQYGDGDVWGTTDITRTIAIGETSSEMKEHYTRVLMGHIDLAMAEFDGETTGKDLDAIARGPLVDKGLNYAHGTGHGVGCYLSVHESAAKGISPRSDAPLAAGMLLSNEPGYYEEGSHGIRIENLVFVEDDERGGLRFNTITFAPIDTSCVVWDLMSEGQVQWLKDYHARVVEVLAPYLDEGELGWLINLQCFTYMTDS